MDFKSWFLQTELTDQGQPQVERPDLLATAIPKFSRKDEPPMQKAKNPLARYLIKPKISIKE